MRYTPPRWLPGGHAQTLYPLLIKPEAPAFRRERWETPDGDFIDLDWKNATETDGDNPLLLLFHGLEGSSDSHYARSLVRAAFAIGWSSVVVHFRGCSGEPNRLPRAYHSGDSEEIDWIVRRLRALHPHRRLHTVGISLGGNALLKWLGEQGQAATALVDTAAAVSAPIDLAACGHHLARGFNALYTQHFLYTLKPTSLAKLKCFPGLLDERSIRRARTLYDFDDAVTAPLHGFAGADDYWFRASSKPWLGGIAVPTLLLNARNDPFLPAHALPLPNQVSPQVCLDFTEQGGHVGFVTGYLPGHLDWMPQRLLRFFRDGS
ncbi:hydrolase [Propionivibrio dicarboxylicus]|uniref:AB hydrolase-1 domain-containing protein n=1 Tax=Propionivibrio dicarboxylicus TaxID=83767 RepID=A0A1G8BLC6_9RHOO|nr:hydrolase [Propionivibrio dicarboxylicus]SDH34039.1 hypothetical protein SAMN05660652_01541 [Propionivibrio dicarboxylicus]